MIDSSDDVPPKNPGNPSSPSVVPSSTESTAGSDAGVIAGETLEPMAAMPSVAVEEKPAKRTEPSTGRSAFFVGSGILISRIIGLIRVRPHTHALILRCGRCVQRGISESQFSSTFLRGARWIPYSSVAAVAQEEKKSVPCRQCRGLAFTLITSLGGAVGVLSLAYHQ